MQCFHYPIKRPASECPEVVVEYRPNRLNTGVDEHVWKVWGMQFGAPTYAPHDTEGSAPRTLQFLDNLITSQREAFASVLHWRRNKLARLEADPNSTPWALANTRRIIAELETTMEDLCHA